MGKRQARRQRGQLARSARKIRDGNGAPPRTDPDATSAAPSAAAAQDTAISAAAPRSTKSPRLTASDVFGTTFWVFGIAAVVTGAWCYLMLGPEVFRSSLDSDLDLIMMLIPRFGAGLIIAAFVKELLPRERIAQYVGDRAGVSALGIATVVGAMTPGGPMTSFPVVRALHEAGTGRASLIAYVTSWSTLGFQRILNWELPLLGVELTALRAIVSLPLPLIAGFCAMMLPKADGKLPADQDDRNV